MLTRLQLRDFVIVEHAELEFAAGMTALTGETGAGKSIVVDALSLLAGGRASADVVRQGAERAEATASFSSLPAPALAWLAEQSIDHEGEVMVRRSVSADGRSRAYLNGQLVPLQSLREFGELLLEIHGQQEFQHLVRRDAQRELLDAHAGARELVAAVNVAFTAHRDRRQQLESLKLAAGDRDARLDLLRYQLTELRAEVTTKEDIAALMLERQRIAGSGRLGEAARAALAAAGEDEAANAADLLGKARAALRHAAGSDPTLAAAERFIAEAAILVGEANATLHRFLEALDIDPARQDEVERRAAALEALARKHRIPLDELPGLVGELAEQLQTLDNSALSLAALEQQLNQCASAYQAAAQRLTRARRRAANDLSGKITALMQTLGMNGGRFEVQLDTDVARISEHGSDEVEFLVSANPGQAPRSLARVASGGELSRLSLAIQVAAAANAGAPCMVFDEVDAGIGGAIAEIVGRQLRALGSRCQVLCVTHLPQVASQAHSQFRVTKQTDGKATRTTLQGLAGAARVDEIARMLGGIDITEKARAHAREMLEQGS